jgi:hypothetical protein
MRVGRGEDGRSKPGRDARKGDFTPETDRQIDRPSFSGVAGVETSNSNITGGKRHHRRPVFQLSRRHTDGRACQRRVAHKNFGNRIPAHHQDALERLLGHGMGDRVFNGILG